jgi:membrane protein
MIQKVEDTFNYIWQVQKSRSLARRFSDYLSVILVGPVLMVTAMGLLATLSASELMQTFGQFEPFGRIIALAGGLGPLTLVVLVFAFVYVLVPNTRVRIGAALVGAVLAGGVWSLGGSLFASVVVGSTRYAAIYSGFAIAVLALIWMYLSWLVLLLGAQVSFYAQNPQQLRRGRNQLTLSIAQVERLALGIMQQVADGFRRGQHPDFGSLAKALDCPARSLEEVTNLLEATGLLVLTEDGAFVPGRTPETIAIKEIFAAVRGEDSGGGDAVAGILREVRGAETERLAGRNLADLVAGDGHPPDQQ